MNDSQIRDAISEYMPHYVFYKKKGRKTLCYCTACHERYMDDPNGRAHGFQSAYKHKEFGTCTRCNADVQYRAWNLGRTSDHCKRNFAVFEAENQEKVIIDCFIATQYFDEDNMEPEISKNPKVRYVLTKDEAIQYRKEYKYFTDGRYSSWGWSRRKSEPSEPIFNSNFLSGWLCDNSYTIINDECLSNTFLKYSLTGLPEQISNHLISYLCTYVKKPNIEYLMKGGFFDLAMHLVRKESGGIRINWRSNNLLKMLKIDRTELKYLCNKGFGFYQSYISFRKIIYCGSNSAETIYYYGHFRNNEGRLIEVTSASKLTFKQVMDYILKQDVVGQGEGSTLIAYRDYLNECKELDYSFDDPAVLVPNKLWAAHDRTMKIVKLKRDKEAAKRLKETNKFRKSLAYADYNAGLITRIPKSINEIVKEGKILSHCVGGYADRHANGKLHIIFLRKISEPETPYYTIEVSLDGKIIQCRGYKNNVVGRGGTEKPQEIIDFEVKYQEYLDTIYNKKKKKVGKSA